MKKLSLIMALALLLAVAVCGLAFAEEPTPTPVPDMIAQPDATRRPITTATPRPADAPLPEDTFLGNAVEIARRLDLLAESEPFFAYCNRSGATREMWDAISRGDHTTPSRIFALDCETLLMGLTDGNPEAAPWFDLSRVELRRDMVSTIPEMMFIGMDKEVVSCIKMLGRYKVYAPTDGSYQDGAGLLVMLYDGGTPIVLWWYANAGAVSISAFFLPSEALEACVSAEDVSAWFASLSMPLVPFEEVTW